MILEPDSFNTTRTKAFHPGSDGRTTGSSRVTRAESAWYGPGRPDASAVSEVRAIMDFMCARDESMQQSSRPSRRIDAAMHSMTHALVTGASSGLGREMVRQLVRDRGMTVLATARRLDELEQLAAELPPGKVHVLAGDLQDAGFREQLWQQALGVPGRAGPADQQCGDRPLCGVCRSGSRQPSARSSSSTSWPSSTSARRPHSHMRERGSGQILQISSVLGFVGIPYSAVYVASKHAVNGLVKSMRYELQGTGVRVWAACPGRTESGFSRNALGHGGEPGLLPRGEPTARVVRSILKGLDRRCAFLVPTWTAWAGLRLAEWCPPLFDWLIVRWATRHVGSALKRKESEPGRPDPAG